MAELESREALAGRVSSDRKLQKQMQMMEDVYRQTEAMGFRIEPDSYGGWGYSIDLNVISREAYSSSHFASCEIYQLINRVQSIRFR